VRIEPYSRVVLIHDVPEEGLCRGDVGTVVEIYEDPSGNPIGFELELFAANGNTLAVASVPADAVRQATSADRLAARVA
jgi:hypothetical protein